jgi:hypothetical protein
MQLLSTLVPEDFRAVMSTPLKRLYLCTTISCVGGASLSGSFMMLRMRRRLNAREDGTELAAPTGRLAASA